MASPSLWSYPVIRFMVYNTGIGMCVGFGQGIERVNRPPNYPPPLSICTQMVKVGLFFSFPPVTVPIALVLATNGLLD